MATRTRGHWSVSQPPGARHGAVCATMFYVAPGIRVRLKSSTDGIRNGRPTQKMLSPMLSYTGDVHIYAALQHCP